MVSITPNIKNQVAISNKPSSHLPSKKLLCLMCTYAFASNLIGNTTHVFILLYYENEQIQAVP